MPQFAGIVVRIAPAIPTLARGWLWAFPPLEQPNNPGCTGALVKMNGKDSGTGGTIVYFSCGDCGVEASRAVQGGGRILKPKESIGQYGFIALVYDTEGNLIGLHSMV